jgi:hypothetical protein
MGDYLNVQSLFQMRDAILQTVADEMQLCRLLETDLAQLDVVPFLSSRHHGDGIPDLDTTRIFFISQSLGSMIGTVFLAFEPSVEAAILNVPGGGLINIFRNAASEVVQGFASGFLPPEATPLERLQLMALEQMPFDLIDPLNYAHHVIADPLAGNRAKQILLQQSIGDGFVPHEGTASLARGLGIPLVGPVLRDIPDLAHASAPAESAGLFQYLVSQDPALAHALLLLQPSAHRQMEVFYRSSAETGTGVIIDPVPERGSVP